jgi:hypothetical protein
MRRKPLDAPENLPKEEARQVAFGKLLLGEVARMPDGASAVLNSRCGAQ